MKKSFYYIVALFIVCLAWSSCGTRKNTKASRFYHAFTSRYNIYFNGKTSFDESLLAAQDGYKESYSDMILMYPISAQPKDKAEPGGAFDRAIEKGNKAIRLHSIQTKPAKKPGWRNNPKERAFQEQEEYNPFLKNCWLLVGQGQFYNADFLQAAATFSYIARHYKHDDETSTLARIWQARCYSELEWFYETEDILQKLNSTGIPKKNLKEYAKVYADYLVKNEQYDNAIPYFKTAIKAEKNRRQRSRMKYLLGQIYTDREQNAMAYKAYAEVIKSNPPYELEFAARIRQTEVFTGGNYQKVVKMLERMAKSDKNKDFLDQVYYAMGNVYLSRQDTVRAIRNYELGAEKSTQNGMDKAILWIKLGDIYFQQREYIKAQPCFSGAMAIIDKEYKDYKRVAHLSEVLDELVVHAEAVHLQDSLQALVRMPETERLAAIDKIIERVIKEEEEAKAQAEKDEYLAQAQAQGTGISRPGTQVATITVPTADGSSFYFYNPQTVAQGKTQFQNKWGRRALEDNWRRSNKRVSTFDENAGQETAAAQEGQPALDENGEPIAADSSAVALPDSMSSDPKTREYYLQQLPFSDEDIAASNIIIIDGLFNMAMIYKDKLNDLPLSIEGFEELERRFPDNEHRMECYYQIYLMALRLEDTALASLYKSKLIAAYPGSDYAVAIADPNYAYNIRVMDAVQDSVYELTYNRYLAEDIRTVRQNYKEISERYPLGTLLPKFMFLNALTYVQEGDAEGFKEALKALVEKYPSADVSELAGEMLKGMLRGRTMMQGSVSGMVWNLRFGGEGEFIADSARTFNTEKNVPHRMLFIYPTGSVDKNQLLFVVAAYNFSRFLVKQFDIEQEEAGPLSMLRITGFSSFEEILQYYKMIYAKDGYASSLSGEIAVVPISDDNYETLMRGKTLDEYLDFLEENFDDDAPELVGRLMTRSEEAKEEEEEEEEQEQGAGSKEQGEAEPEEQAEPEVITPPATIAPDTIAVPDTIAPDTIAVQDTLMIPAIPVAPADSIAPAAPDTITPPSGGRGAGDQETDLTLDQVKEIRKREAEEEAIRKEEERKAKEEADRIEQERLDEEKRQKEELRLRRKAEEEALLKAKAEQEKQLDADRKAKANQAAADRKAKEKAQQQLRKQKEKEYKQRLRQKEKERKAKEQEYKQKLKDREKARREAQKQKEADRKARTVTTKRK